MGTVVLETKKSRQKYASHFSFEALRLHSAIRMLQELNSTAEVDTQQS